MAKQVRGLAALALRLNAATEQQQYEAILAIVKKHAQRIIDLNHSQLLEGVDSRGKSLGEYSSILYAQFKKKLNSRGVVDLKVTGEFWEGFFVDASEWPVKVDSNDWKRNKLVKQYGKDIFGLTKENQLIFDAEIRRDVIAYYKDLLGI